MIVKGRIVKGIDFIRIFYFMYFLCYELKYFAKNYERVRNFERFLGSSMERSVVVTRKDQLPSGPSAQWFSVLHCTLNYFLMDVMSERILVRFKELEKGISS